MRNVFNLMWIKVSRKYCLYLQCNNSKVVCYHFLKCYKTKNMATKKRLTLDEVFAEWRALQPLDDDTRQRLSRKFAVEYNYNSNNIEGNTLTYGQTELLLMFGKVSGEGCLRDFNEMKASAVGF